MSKNKKTAQNNKIVVILASVSGVLLLGIIVMLLMLPKTENQEVTAPSNTTVNTETVPTDTVPTETESIETEATIPAETEPVMLENMAELYAKNPDIVGWVRIEGTKLDYPVMYTPEDEEKYIYKNFEEKYHIAGLPFVDKDCSMSPESDNIIMYGHNMNNGTAFATIMQYEKKDFWEKHPTIYFSTLYEERTYEVVAAFRDRVYYSYEDVFKFYQFIDAEDEETFNDAMMYFKENTKYDTGVTAEYGDNFITLVTCAYHHKFGRFVVVARQITDEEVVPATESVN